MKIDWRTKDMNYICQNALPKLPVEFLRKIADHLNQTQEYNIPTFKKDRKTIINCMAMADIKTSHYWVSFAHVTTSEILQLKYELAEIRQGIEELKQ